ncbi:ras-domain-containing protein [Phaffia rhodozyma]|uniref:Ras-domain-containing protein n=1 Tax=Phaffia rhodozyma TaxID=264483 RepID=A0A0F7SIQ5_PHARH|nr:ras-domain-containing protein [Phaffia rhodozyma]
MSSVKVVLIGDSGVGKTSLRNQYLSQKFSTAYKATIGCDFVTQQIPVSEDMTVNLAIWDTAGQERFASLSSAFFRGSDAAILVYDVTKPETLVSLKKWFYEFVDRCPVRTLEDRRRFCFVVVGNKSDRLSSPNSNKQPNGRKAESEEVQCVRDEEVRKLWEELIPPRLPKQHVDKTDGDDGTNKQKSGPRSSFSTSFAAAAARLRSFSSFSSSSSIPEGSSSVGVASSDPPTDTSLEPNHTRSIDIHHCHIPPNHSISSGLKPGNHRTRSCSPGKLTNTYTGTVYHTPSSSFRDHPELQYLSREDPIPSDPYAVQQDTRGNPKESVPLAPPSLSPAPITLTTAQRTASSNENLLAAVPGDVKPLGTPSVKTTASSFVSFNTARTNLSDATTTLPSSNSPSALSLSSSLASIGGVASPSNSSLSSSSSFFASSALDKPKTFKRSDSMTSQTSKSGDTYASSAYSADSSTSTVRPNGASISGGPLTTFTHEPSPLITSTYTPNPSSDPTTEGISRPRSDSGTETGRRNKSAMRDSRNESRHRHNKSSLSFVTTPGIISPSASIAEDQTGSSSAATVTSIEWAQKQDGGTEEPTIPPPLRVSGEMPMLFLATSAKTGEGVNEIFEYVAKRVWERWEHEKSHPIDPLTAYEDDEDSLRSRNIDVARKQSNQSKTSPMNCLKEWIVHAALLQSLN